MLGLSSSWRYLEAIMAAAPCHTYLALVVPKALVKQVKDALDGQGMLDKRTKIKPISNECKCMLLEGNAGTTREGSFYVPVVETKDGDASLSMLTRLIGMHSHEQEFSIVAVSSDEDLESKRTVSQTNLLARTIEQWLQCQPQRQCDSPDQSMTIFKKKSHLCNWTFTIYPPLLLLPPTFFSNLSSIVTKDKTPDQFPSLYSLMCENLGVSHIALSAPIPHTVMISASLNRDPMTTKNSGRENESSPNILRSPTGLAPLYGDFGPDSPLEHQPTKEDFASAFWCTAQQNGIFQTWAPRYVMFSRGNVSEKARILNVTSLKQEALGTRPQETSAVDFYAGIGYFAFSYAKAGMSKVLCWELNPWSVEGLRRGACGNGWGVDLTRDGERYQGAAGGDTRFLVFRESNENAPARINVLRDTIPPIKHVNCGYLPSSKDSWETAVQVLDPTGGWIHAHENVAKKDIESRKDEIVEIFTRLVERFCRESRSERWRIECEHVERVKSYAPGVMHCVFDIAIMPVDPP